MCTFSTFATSIANLLSPDSLLLTLMAGITAGIYIYLPDHLRSIYGHLYYYWAGERPFISSRLGSISSVFGESATQGLEVVYESAKNAAAATTTQYMAEL